MLMCWKSPCTFDNICETRQEGIDRDQEAKKRPLGGAESSLQPAHGQGRFQTGSLSKHRSQTAIVPNAYIQEPKELLLWYFR